MALAHCIVHGHTPTDLHEVDPKRFPMCFNSVPALSARVPETLGQHYAITFPGLQARTARNLVKTPLHAQWSAEKAIFGQFFGWERPLYFNSPEQPALTFGRPAWFDQVKEEVEQAHLRAAIFDQSTFGKILVEGPDAERFLDRLCANDMARPAGRVIYTSMLNERGGFESDLTALRIDDETYRLYVGTAAIRRDLSWLRGHLQHGERVTLKDESGDYSVLALMGPDAARIAGEIGAGELNELGYFRHGKAHIADRTVRGARLSYIGESGWEITCASADVLSIYEQMYAAGARPSGLYAQTSMRVEKRFLAFGHDIDSDVTPLEAGLDFAIDWDRDFIGREALRRRREEGPQATLLTLLFDDTAAVPLGNEPVYMDGNAIGKTTSAAYGYRMGKPVAIASLKSDPVGAAGEAVVEVDIARTMFKATAQRGPAFDPAGSRMRSSGI